MNAKVLMAKEYGIDWNNADDAQKYRDELESRVYEGLLYNYAVQILLNESGYTLDNEDISALVQKEMEALIDECGSKRQYKIYLAENYLTDRIARFNISISYALNELLFLLNDRGVFSEYVNFDIESINPDNALYFNEDDYSEALGLLLGGNIWVRSEHIFISADINDAEALALSLKDKAKDGKSLSELASENASFQYQELYQFEGELDPEFFGAVCSVEEQDVTVIQLDSGWYVIKRLAPPMEFIFNNCYDIAYQYLFIKMNEHIAEYEKTLTIEFTDFGKSIDLTKMN